MIVEAVSQATMILSAKHIVLTTRLLVALFIVANSGFTTVIRQCTMEPAHPMDCCAASGERHNTPIGGPRPQGEATVAGVLPDCSISTVVGGLANAPALLDKENTVHSSKIITSIPLSELPAFFNTITKRSFHSSDPSLTFSPHSTEKCVLNSTFLI
jgi:hypothetical protein